MALMRPYAPKVKLGSHLSLIATLIKINGIFTYHAELKGKQCYHIIRQVNLPHGTGTWYSFSQLPHRHLV